MRCQTTTPDTNPQYAPYPKDGKVFRTLTPRMKRNQNRFEKKSKNPKAPKQLPLEKQIQEDQELVNKTRNKKRKQNDENSVILFAFDDNI